MDKYESLSHSVWECKYHVVFIPKCRRKTLYAALRPHLGRVFRQLAEHRESRVEEGHLMADHVHMLLSILPKYGVSQAVGYMKSKGAIHLARTYAERKRNWTVLSTGITDAMTPLFQAEGARFTELSPAWRLFRFSCRPNPPATYAAALRSRQIRRLML